MIDYISSPIYLIMDMGPLHFLVIVTNTTMNMNVKYLLGSLNQICKYLIRYLNIC
jgi:hypothetical protein